MTRVPRRLSLAQIEDLERVLQCSYCGDFADCRDHVPPRWWRPGSVRRVPACKRCCRLLIHVFALTVEDRRAYVLFVLQAKPGACAPGGVQADRVVR